MTAYRPRRSLRPVRPRLPRRALPWYAAAVGLSVLTGALVTGALQRAAEAEAAYGTTHPVVVVSRALAAGEPIGPGDLTVERWPSALVPASAERAPPEGAVALVDLEPGEALLTGRTSSGAEAPAALLAPDERAVPVPVTVPGLELHVGDRVDLLGGGAPGGGPAGDLPVRVEADIVAADAGVVAVGEETVVVAVDVAAAADVAAALTAGPVLLALRPPGR